MSKPKKNLHEVGAEADTKEEIAEHSGVVKNRKISVEPEESACEQQQKADGVREYNEQQERIRILQTKLMKKAETGEGLTEKEAQDFIRLRLLAETNAPLVKDRLKALDQMAEAYGLKKQEIEVSTPAAYEAVWLNRMAGDKN